LEYLAAGKPVVSTSIRDVVDPYERLGLVRIADAPADFIAAVEAALVEDRERFTATADAFLEHRSWDETWARMAALIDRILDRADAEAPTAGSRSAERTHERTAQRQPSGAGAPSVAGPR
jgi:hypothetical protein